MTNLDERQTSYPAPNHDPIRITVQQPALPRYRVPVFRELARRSNLQIKVVYAYHAINVPPEAAYGFEAVYMPQREIRLGRHSLYWHTPQWRYASRAQSDVLILSSDMHYLSLIPALLRARASGVATLLWGHGYSKQEAVWRTGPRRAVAHLATALLFYNRTTARSYLEMGWDSARIHVASNSLDQTPIQEAKHHWLGNPQRLADFRREHSLNYGNDGPVVLFVSRLATANRLDLLLEAAAILRGDYPKLQVVIIGKGEAESELRTLSQTLGISDQVYFPGAIYDEMQLAPWFLSADIFCYPANIGLSLLHAFGYGLPVVTSDRLQSQNPEIEALRPGINGLLYAHGDARSLSGALRRIIADRAFAQQLSDQAHHTVIDDFTLNHMVDGMEAAVRYCAHQVFKPG